MVLVAHEVVVPLSSGGRDRIRSDTVEHAESLSDEAKDLSHPGVDVGRHSESDSACLSQSNDGKANHFLDLGRGGVANEDVVTRRCSVECPLSQLPLTEGSARKEPSQWSLMRSMAGRQAQSTKVAHPCGVGHGYLSLRRKGAVGLGSSVGMGLRMRGNSSSSRASLPRRAEPVHEGTKSRKERSVGPIGVIKWCRGRSRGGVGASRVSLLRGCADSDVDVVGSTRAASHRTIVQVGVVPVELNCQLVSDTGDQQRKEMWCE